MGHRGVRHRDRRGRGRARGAGCRCRALSARAPLPSRGIEVDWSAKTITAWFQDRYEWHPVYPGLYNKEPGDVARGTNCVHAALVELQSSGAADYWMKGEATVPLSAFSAGASAPKKGSGSI